MLKKLLIVQFRLWPHVVPTFLNNLFSNLTAFISLHSFKSPTEAWYFTSIFSLSW